MLILCCCFCEGITFKSGFLPMATPLLHQKNLSTIIKCPTCQQPTSWQDNPHRPFCSDRCRLIDLGCWAEEGYRVPVEDGSGLSEFLENNE
jgi:uncharacterized protein